MGNTTASGRDSQERLLQALAEQLKTPLMHIARQAELIQEGEAARGLSRIEETANLALTLVDNYLLSTKLAQTALELEPVSLSAVLHDTAEQLSPIAHQYHCELQLSLGGKYGPVMAHRSALQAALVSMGHAFIESGLAHTGRMPVVTLATHRGSKGIITGVYGESGGLSASVFQRSKVLYGRSQQPLQAFTASSGAGIFVADSLFAAMDARLRVGSYKKTAGLAATLLPSRQLSLV
jgi:K+-sensing histidine kinase KdpD